METPKPGNDAFILKQGPSVVAFIDEGHSVIRRYKYQGGLL